MNDYKIPWEELSGEANLKGKYKVSFYIDVTEDDQMSVDDVRQSIATGFSGDPVLYKISRLDLEKTDQDGNSLPSKHEFHVGDTVVISEDVEIEAKVDTYDGVYIVGAKSLSVEPAGTGTVLIASGTTAKINKIEGDTVELIELDAVASAAIRDEETDEVLDVIVNVDSVIFSNNYIAPLKSEEE